MSCDHKWSTYGFQYPRGRICFTCGEVHHDVTEDLDRELGYDADSDRFHPSRWLRWEAWRRQEEVV